MADKKITQLTNITGANLVDADEFVVVDISADETKAITLGELKEAFDSGSGFVRITGDTMTGDLTVPNVITSGNVDGRDISVDGTKLDTIETNADVTDTTNVTSAGALMTTGGTMTGNVAHGDNVKATFGASADLEIYSDGTDGIVTTVSDLKINSGHLILNTTSKTPDASLVTTDTFIQYAENTAPSSTIVVASNVAGDRGVFKAVKSGGTLDTPTSPSDGDDVFTLLGAIYDGATTYSSAGVSFYVDGVVSTGVAPQGIEFLTGSAGRSTRLSVGSSGDISFYEDTGSTAKLTWDASNEALEFGDNVKATFGASADLQVYHDGSRSLISDQGTGNLVIRAGDFTVQNPEGTETFIQATRNGSVDLYYDQGTYTTPKLSTTSSGIDVTGTVTADGATFDGEVSVGLTQGDISLEDLNNQAADTDAGIILNGGGTIRSGMFTEADGEILSYAINMPQIDASYDQTRSGGNFRLDTRSTENVFVVKRRAENSTSISSAIEISLNDGSTHLFGDLQVDGSVEFSNWTITESGGSLYFATGGTNKMKLDASGNLDVVGSVNSNATIS